MDLSPHLSSEEFVATSHREYLAAQRAAWCPALHASARRFAREVFEPVRALLGCALHVNSGFRCAALNAAVGGAPTSRHVLGLAADVVPVGMDLAEAWRRVVLAVRDGRLEWLDMAIVECGSWIHIQAAGEGEPRRRLMVAHWDPAAGCMRYEEYRDA